MIYIFLPLHGCQTNTDMLLSETSTYADMKSFGSFQVVQASKIVFCLSMTENFSQHVFAAIFYHLTDL